MKRRLMRLAVFGALWALGPSWYAVEAHTFQPVVAAHERKPRLPGEFEHQAAVLLSWSSDAATDEALVDIIVAAGSATQFVVLVSAEDAVAEAAEKLRLAGVPLRRVRFLQLPYDTVWTRDYGPLVVESADGTPKLLDATYPCRDRANDDCVPAALALTLALPLAEVPLDLDGGNLLSNGAGLCLTTTQLVEQNEHRGYDEEAVRRILMQHLGFSDVVFLEPLVDEPTGHVDMFATFPSANTVVVGQVPGDVDEVNSAVLDRNAERLSRVTTSRGRLQVARVPMPSAEDGNWRTYTNVLYANGRLVMPVYPDADVKGYFEAARTYQRLLPSWKVMGVDCSDLIGQGGAVHCVTLNLCRFPKIEPTALPEVPPRIPAELFPDRRWWDGAATRDRMEGLPFRESSLEPARLRLPWQVPAEVNSWVSPRPVPELRPAGLE